MDSSERTSSIAAVLLGTSLGDALGLPAEGMSRRRIERRFGEMERFRLLGRTGYLSDDTEQSVLVAQSYANANGEPEAVERHFRRALKWWFLRLPFGIGWSTLKACVLLVLGVSKSGRRSAGNGAAMRAAVLGALEPDDAEKRRQLGRRVARVTHVDPRAVQGALYTAEVTANLIRGQSVQDAVEGALCVLDNSELRDAVQRAIQRAHSLSGNPEDTHGNTGYIVHTLALATHFLLVAGGNALATLSVVIAAGGDTDSIAAIVGAWLGARDGVEGLPEALLCRIHNGPFGPHHIRAVASAIQDGHKAPRYSWAAALLRNLSLYPVVLAHGFRRLLPW